MKKAGKPMEFDPVVGWISRNIESPPDFGHSLGFRLDGRCCRIVSNMEIGLNNIRTALVSLGIEVDIESTDWEYACETFFLELDHGKNIALPFGMKQKNPDTYTPTDGMRAITIPEDALGDLESTFWGPEPSSVAQSGDFFHILWDEVKCLWRPFDFLASYHTEPGRPLRVVLAHRNENDGDSDETFFQDCDELGLLAVEVFLRWRNQYCLHAGLVHGGGRSVIITGESGAGKTTTVLSLVRAGYSYLGDELCRIRFDGSESLRVSGFKSVPRFVGEAPESLDRLESSLGREETETKKPFALPPEIIAESGHDWLAPDALLFLRQNSDHPAGHKFSRISKNDVFAQLLQQVLDPTSFFSSRVDQMKILLHLADSCPGYELELGTRLDTIHETVEEIFEDAESRS